MFQKVILDNLQLKDIPVNHILVYFLKGREMILI